MQREFSDLICCSFRSYAPDMHPSVRLKLATSVSRCLWDDGEVIKAWCEGGGCYVRNVHPNFWTQDREILLWIVQHGSYESASKAISDSDPTLRSDESFLLQAASFQGRDVLRLRLLRPDQLVKYRVFLIFMSAPTDEECWIRYRRILDGSDTSLGIPVGSTIGALVERIFEQLRTHQIYTKLILCAISSTQEPACALSLLNQDDESGLALKKAIAAYLDLPTRNHLRTLRAALANLLNYWRRATRLDIEY